MSGVASKEQAKRNAAGRVTALLGVGAMLLLTTYLMFAEGTGTSLGVRLDFRNWHFTASELVHSHASTPDALKEITTTRYFGPVIVTTRRYEGWRNLDP